MAHKKITALAAAFIAAACQATPKQDTGIFIKQENLRKQQSSNTCPGTVEKKLSDFLRSCKMPSSPVSMRLS